MARAGIKKSEVFEAANFILAQGASPTIESIRLRLGTGSFTTISEYFREWKKLNQSSDPSLLSEELPHELMGVIKGLWQRVFMHANEKIQLVESQFEQKHNELLENLEGMNQENISLKKDNEVIKNEKNILLNEKASLEKNIVAYEKSLMSLQEKNNALTNSSLQKQELVEELRLQLKRSQDSLTHFSEQSRLQLNTVEERHANERMQLEKSNQDQKILLKAITEDKIRLELLNQQLQQENDEAKKLLHSLQLKFEGLDQQFKVQQASFNHLKLSFDEIKIQNEKLSQDNLLFMQNTIVLEKEITILNDKIHEKNSNIKELNERNESLLNEKIELTQEKFALRAEIKQLEAFFETKNKTSSKN